MCTLLQLTGLSGASCPPQLQGVPAITTSSAGAPDRGVQFILQVNDKSDVGETSAASSSKLQGLVPRGPTAEAPPPLPSCLSSCPPLPKEARPRTLDLTLSAAGAGTAATAQEIAKTPGVGGEEVQMQPAINLLSRPLEASSSSELLSTPDMPALPGLESIFSGVSPSTPVAPQPPSCTSTSTSATESKSLLRTPTCELPPDVLGHGQLQSPTMPRLPSVPIPPAATAKGPMSSQENVVKLATTDSKLGFSLEAIMSHAGIPHRLASTQQQPLQEQQHEQPEQSQPQPPQQPQPKFYLPMGSSAIHPALPARLSSGSGNPPPEALVRLLHPDRGGSPTMTTTTNSTRLTANVTLPDGSIIQVCCASNAGLIKKNISNIKDFPNLQVPIVNGNKLPSIHIVQPNQVNRTSQAVQPPSHQSSPPADVGAAKRPRAGSPSQLQPFFSLPPPPPPPYPSRPLSSSASQMQVHPLQQQVTSTLHSHPPRPHSLPILSTEAAEDASITLMPELGEQNAFRCNRCRLQFTVKEEEDGASGIARALEHHCATAHPGQKATTSFSCGQCGKVFSTAELVSKHVQEAHHHSSSSQQPGRQQQLHVCPVCGDSFSAKVPLKLHFQQWHLPPVGTPVPTPPTPTMTEAAAASSSPLECSTCRRSFSSRSSLKRHQQHSHRQKVSPKASSSSSSANKRTSEDEQSEEKKAKRTKEEEKSGGDQSIKQSAVAPMEKIVIPSPEQGEESRLPESKVSQVGSRSEQQEDTSPAPADYLCAKCGKSFRNKGGFTVHSIVCGKNERRMQERVKEGNNSDSLH